MTYYVDALDEREYKTLQMPSNFQTYCAKCTTMLRPGTLVKRYDGATYTHETCPKTPFKTFAAHRYLESK